MIAAPPSNGTDHEIFAVVLVLVVAVTPHGAAGTAGFVNVAALAVEATTGRAAIEQRTARAIARKREARGRLGEMFMVRLQE